MKQFDLFIEHIYKSNANGTKSVIISCYLIYFFHDYGNQNITIFKSFQIKSASCRIIFLMIMTTLIKVRRKSLTFVWLHLTLRYQNISAQPLILLHFCQTSTLWHYLPPRTGGLKLHSDTELVFNIPNLAHILQMCLRFVVVDLLIT